jgi:hypothetical protein
VTAGQLPSEGPDRGIFLTALARMSAQCQAPDLIAECPFSIDLPTGGRGCGEECEDLLRIYGPAKAPGPPASDGIAFEARPRIRPSREVVSKVVRAFDASEIYYRDSENGPPSSWSAVALFVSVKRIFEQHPFDRSLQQHQEVHACLAELARRGFDADAILRGLAAIVAPAIVTDVVRRTIIDAESPEVSSGTVDSRVSLRDSMHASAESEGPWAGMRFGPELGSQDEQTRSRIVFTIAGPFADHVSRWCRAAELDDLLSWDVTDSVADPPPRDPSDAIAAWLFDRFTVTYLSEWAPESLRLEWRYRKGSQPASIPHEQMMLRHIEIEHLANLVADLAVNGDEKVLRDDRLVKNAVVMLKAGNREAATALFDAVRQSDWNDAQLHNNFGFCILPDDPSQALSALDLAFKSGYTETVNIANRALCLFRLGRPVAAIELLESTFEVWDDLDTAPAYVWAIDEKDKERLLHECPRCYLVKLGAHVARSTGDTSLIDVWDRRVQKLPNNRKSQV